MWNGLLHSFSFSHDSRKAERAINTFNKSIQELAIHIYINLLVINSGSCMKYELFIRVSYLIK